MIATPKMKCGAPILVSADLALAPGQTQSAPLSDLSFGSRYAVLIDEIRFRISSVSKVNPLVPGGFLQDLRGNIRVMLKIGRFNITDSFTDSFGIVDTMTGGGPARATNLMVFKIFNDGFQGLDYSGAAAQSIILMFLVVALTFVQFRYIERKVHYT